MQNKTNQWDSLPNLGIARSHPSVACHKGKIYIFGGGGPNFKSLNSAARFDPQDNIWTQLSPMPTLRSGTMAATVGDKIYVMGGGFRQEDGMFQFLTKVEIYHPETDQWETGPDLLKPHDYPAVAVLNQNIYILGGHHPDATQGGPKTDPGFDFCERLNTETNQGWQAIAPLPTPRFALSAVTKNGKILAMGGVAFRPEGFNNFTTIEIFDPSTGEWSTTSNFGLPWPAAGLGSAMLNDQIYIFGGYSDDSIHNRTAVYDDTSNTWLPAGNLPNPVAAMGVTTCDNHIYSIGGWANDGRTPIDNCYKLTP